MSRSDSDSSNGDSLGSFGVGGGDLPEAGFAPGFAPGFGVGFDGGPTSASRSISSVTRASSLSLLSFLPPGLECSRRISLSEADLPRLGPSDTASSGSRTILTSLSDSSSIGTMRTLLSGEESLLGRLLLPEPVLPLAGFSPGARLLVGFLGWPGPTVLGRLVEEDGALGAGLAGPSSAESS